MKKIGVVTGTRAEYGLLKPLMQKIRVDEELSLCLMVTGTHLERQFGETYREIEQDGFFIDHKVDMRLSTDTAVGICQSVSLGLCGFSEVFEKEKPDMLVVLGDRYEIQAVVTAAMLHQINVAHIHGGELTEGMMDDAIRHTITKMSDLHFTSTAAYRKRVIQMGEQPGRVFSVGALGVENIRECSLFNRKDFLEKFKIPPNLPIVVVTYHPVTLEQGKAKEQFENLLEVISDHEKYYYIFTYANADVDGQSINELIDSYTRSHENALAVISMGQKGYLSALRCCAFVVGNSSSGIIEAPSFGVPTINIGERQKGRIRAASVIDCGYETAQIREAFKTAQDEGFKEQCIRVENPYEGTHTSENILRGIKQFLCSQQGKKKKFYDIDFEAEAERGCRTK